MAQRGIQRFVPHDVLMMSALWSAALYLILPETKARYAVYTFIAFLPLLETAVNASEPANVRRRVCAEIALCVILIGGLMPDLPKVYGVGLVGALLLWLENLRLINRGVPHDSISLKARVLRKPRIDRRHVPTDQRGVNALILPRRAIRAARPRIEDDFEQVSIRIDDPRRREAVALPRDDVLAAVLDQAGRRLRRAAPTPPASSPRMQ